MVIRKAVQPDDSLRAQRFDDTEARRAVQQGLCSSRYGTVLGRYNIGCLNTPMLKHHRGTTIRLHDGATSRRA